MYLQSTGDGGVNHAVLFGKNADGTRYIYNPMGDSKSSEALDKMAAKMMGMKKFGSVTDDFHSKVTNYGD